VVDAVPLKLARGVLGLWHEMVAFEPGPELDVAPIVAVHHRTGE
jgi:hypothetical protein